MAGCCSCVPTCLRGSVIVGGFVLVLCGWVGVVLVLTGQSFLVNEHYSAKTLHLHKVTAGARTPSQWNSLGSMTPYLEEQQQKTTYFVFEDNSTQAQTDSYTTLDDPFSYNMYINSDKTLSILSSISPAVYIATLIVACNLSLVYFFVAMLQVQPMYSDTDNSKSNYMKGFLCNLTLLEYGALLFWIFATSGMVQDVKWHDAEVEYMISQQIPSVVYCILVLGMYYVHLQRTDSSEQVEFWKDVFGVKSSTKSKEADTDEQQPSKGVLGTVVYGPEQEGGFRGSDSAFGQNLVHSMVMPRMYTQSTEALRTWKTLPGQTQQVWMNSSASVMKQESNSANRQEGDKETGPVSNETSILVCLIVFLGGLANLGMSKGFMMETEAQLVVMSLFTFCVLELGRTHLVSYFWYLSVHHSSVVADGENKKMLTILVFVDVVVCLLQYFIVVIWQITMSSLLTFQQFDVLRLVLLVVVVLFLALRTASVVQGLLELLGCSCCACGDSTSGNWGAGILWKTEAIVYLFCVFLCITVMLSMPSDSKMPSKDNPERGLLFLEQMMYQKTESPVTDQTTCYRGINQTGLMSGLTHICKSDDAYKYAADDKISPVTMKVFAWTRSFKLQDKIASFLCSNKCASAAVLFCSNGFEQHWGQCKREFKEPNNMPDNWQALVKSSKT